MLKKILFILLAATAMACAGKIDKKDFTISNVSILNGVWDENYNLNMDAWMKREDRFQEFSWGKSYVYPDSGFWIDLGKDEIDGKGFYSGKILNAVIAGNKQIEMVVEFRRINDDGTYEDNDRAESVCFNFLDENSFWVDVRKAPYYRLFFDIEDNEDARKTIFMRLPEYK